MPRTVHASGAVTDNAPVRLVDLLEEHDDVQNVYGNFELSDALMQKMAG